MNSTKAGKDASLQDGGVFFQTFQKLLKQREALDLQILRLQGRFLKTLEKKASSSRPKKRYVPRMDNKTILRDAIRECMTPGQEMTMAEILEALKSSEAYHTQSEYFYTMVNNKLNRDPRVKKVSRGVFVLQKTGQKRRKAS